MPSKAAASRGGKKSTKSPAFGSAAWQAKYGKKKKSTAKKK
jgi:hypothetical protein